MEEKLKSLIFKCLCITSALDMAEEFQERAYLTGKLVELQRQIKEKIDFEKIPLGVIQSVWEDTKMKKIKEDLLTFMSVLVEFYVFPDWILATSNKN